MIRRGARLTVNLSRYPVEGPIDAIRVDYENIEHLIDSDYITPYMYERSQIRPGVVNLGLRNFHRVHSAVYFNDLLSRPENSDWGIVSVGLTDSHLRPYNALRGQNGLYTVVERGVRGGRGV